MVSVSSNLLVASKERHNRRVGLKGYAWLNSGGRRMFGLTSSHFRCNLLKIQLYQATHVYEEEF